jgi:hypothetical protein
MHITIQADNQEINISKLGGTITASGFKRRNAREGPLDIIDAASTVTTGKDKEGGRAEKSARSRQSFRGASMKPRNAPS